MPEANGARPRRPARGNLVANPNCTTAAAVVALAPIRDLAGLESVDLASYQAVSGAGRAGLDAYVAERAAGGAEPRPSSPFHGRIADSVVPQIDVLDDDGWTGEERKITAELRKILELPEPGRGRHHRPRAGPHRPLCGSPPPHRARRDASTELEAALREAPGLEYRPADGSSATRCRSTWPAAIRCSSGGCARFPDGERGFALFLSSDNLRKGAALNAIQVAACADPERFGRLPASSIPLIRAPSTVYPN